MGKRITKLFKDIKKKEKKPKKKPKKSTLKEKARAAGKATRAREAKGAPIEKTFQGPVRPGTDEEKFRETGISEEDDIIRLGGERKPTETILEKTQDIPVLGKALAILASPKTTLVLATTLGVLTGLSAVQSAAAVGKSTTAATLNIQTIRAGGSAFYATNTATLAKSTSMIAKIATQLGKPKLVASAIAGLTVGAIGSYPFAGFIKEEALQAIKGSYTGAMIQGDMDLAQLAIDERQEILDPSLTEKILGLIPYANIVKQLRDYFDTARTAVAIDQQLIDKQINQIETGDTDEEYWANINAERDAAREQQRIDDAAYFEQVRQNAAEAKAAAREEDQEYWNKVFADQEKRKQAQREAEEAYWAAVRIENDKLSNAKSQQYDNAKSNLNFGLL